MVEEIKTNEMSLAAQRVAKRFIEGRKKAQRAKQEAQDELNGLKELRKKRQAKLRDAQKVLKQFDDDNDVLMAIAGLDIKKDEAVYQKQAATCLFALLGKIRKDSSLEKANVPSLQEMIDKLIPAELLFDILEKVAVFDDKTKILSIDGKMLYTMICDRVKEQNQRLEEARKNLKKLEETMEKDEETADSGEVVEKEETMEKDEETADSGKVVEKEETESKVLEEKKAE